MTRAPHSRTNGQNRTMSNFVFVQFPDRHGHTPIGVSVCPEDHAAKKGDDDGGARRPAGGGSLATAGPNRNGGTAQGRVNFQISGRPG